MRAYILLPPVFTRADALRAGYGRSQIAARVRSGCWMVLARGAYCLAETWEAASPADRQLLIASASLMTVAYPAWASHASAAALHDLPVPHDVPAWITRQPSASTRNTDLLKVEVATLPERDRWTVQGLPCTSLRRTVADCLRHLAPHHGLAVADAAEHLHPGTAEQAGRVLADCEDWPYAARAWEVYPVIDGRRESPLESWSYWFMHRFAVPMPEPQVDVYDEWGSFLGRADAWWEAYGVAGEADGRTKYRVGPGETIKNVEQRLYDEKRREDGFRRHGAGMIRWGSSDLLPSPWRWAQGIRRRLEQHGPSQFRGHVVRRERVSDPCLPQARDERTRPA